MRKFNSIFNSCTGKMYLTKAEEFRKMIHEKYQDIPYEERQVVPNYCKDIQEYLTVQLLHPDYSSKCNTVEKLCKNFLARIEYCHTKCLGNDQRHLVGIFYAHGILDTASTMTSIELYPHFWTSPHSLPQLFWELEQIAILEESESVGYSLFDEESQRFLGPEINNIPDEIEKILRTARFADSHSGAK